MTYLRIDREDPIRNLYREQGYPLAPAAGIVGNIHDLDDLAALLRHSIEAQAAVIALGDHGDAWEPGQRFVMKRDLRRTVAALHALVPGISAADVSVITAMRDAARKYANT